MQSKLDHLQRLLTPASFPESACLLALAAANGNIRAAATALLDPSDFGEHSTSTSDLGTGRCNVGVKRKARQGLGGWLGSPGKGSRPGAQPNGATLSRRPSVDPPFEISDSDEDGEITLSKEWTASNGLTGRGIGDAISLASDEDDAKNEIGTSLAAKIKPPPAKRARIRSTTPPEPIRPVAILRALPPPPTSSKSIPTSSTAPPPVSSSFTSPAPPTLLTLLRPPPPSPALKKKNPPQPPIMVPPHRVPFYLPTCTLESSPLGSRQASALYLALLEEVRGFERPKWYLNGKMVESPHTHAFYRLSEAEGGLKTGGEYWYAGRPEPAPPDFPPLLRKAVKLINPFVNDLLAVRSRSAFEYGEEWEANVAAVNHYEGAASGVGWHADQLTHLGPCTTIVSLSLGTPRGFRLRPSASLLDPILDSFGKPLRTYEIVLRHNSLFIMHALTQEYYKHTVPVQNNKSLDLFKPGWDVDEVAISPEHIKGYNSRINVTFRMYRKDFHPLAEPIGPMGVPREGTTLCHCGIPCILRADQKGKARASRADPVAAKDTNLDSLATAEIPHGHGFGQEMTYFWMCNSGQMTGEVKGCGFFRLLDMRAEGRGPCIGWKTKVESHV